MFGKDADGHEVDSRQTSILAQGCRFEGTVTANGTFRIEGEFKGDIGVPENLVIGKSGVVHGTINAKNAIIGELNSSSESSQLKPLAAFTSSFKFSTRPFDSTVFSSSHIF